MPRKMLLKSGLFEAKALLLDAPNTKTAEAVWEKLPIEGKAERWGEEIYFFVQFNIAQEQGKQVVEEGDIAFWPEGPQPLRFSLEKRLYPREKSLLLIRL
ncbi:MAG: cyclophilin-like family protein [Candidatus Diapherotrites archaeon]